MKYHYIKDMVQRGAIKLSCIVTNEQIADVLKKSMSLTKFTYFPDKLGVAKNASLIDREC